MIKTAGKTFQQVLDEITDKLEAQGKRCMDVYSCLYSDGEGNHCAVGWLLSETVTLRGDAKTLTETYPDLGENDAFIREYTTELTYVQAIHDGACSYSKESLNKMGYNVERLFQLCNTPEFRKVEEQYS